MKLALHHGQGRRLKKDKIAMSINASSNNGRGTSRDALSDSSNSSNREDKRLTVTEAMLSLQLSMVIKADNNPREEAVQLMYILRVKRNASTIGDIFIHPSIHPSIHILNLLETRT